MPNELDPGRRNTMLQILFGEPLEQPKLHNKATGLRHLEQTLCSETSIVHQLNYDRGGRLPVYALHQTESILCSGLKAPVCPGKEFCSRVKVVATEHINHENLQGFRRTHTEIGGSRWSTRSFQASAQVADLPADVCHRSNIRVAHSSWKENLPEKSYANSELSLSQRIREKTPMNVKQQVSD